MRDLSEININEGGEPISRLAPTTKVINEFESRFGVKLPDDYLVLLRHTNGGHPELDTFEPLRPFDEVFAVNRFYHLDEDRKSHDSLWVATETWRRVLGDSAVPFALDGGGNQFFLDVKKTPAAVNVCTHDERFRVLELAGSFAQFIDGLAVDPDSI